MARFRLLGAAAGLLAAAAGLGVAEALAALITAPSPVVAVGTWAIDTSPQGLTNWAIEHFRANDKKVLVSGVLATIAVIAAVAGAVGVTARRVAIGLSTAVGAVGVLAVATVRGATGSPLVRIVPAVAALAVSTGSLLWLLASMRTPQPPADAPAGDQPGAVGAGPLGRREFVRAFSTVGAVAVAGGLVREIGRSGDRIGVVSALPPAAGPAPTVRNADFALPGLSRYFTSNADFYRVDTAIVVPVLDAGNWRLRIDGMVSNPLTITYEQLLASRLIERDVTLTCVSNEVGGDLIGNARWLGLPIRELLAAAGPKPGADAVRSMSVDGWTAGTPLSALTDPGRDAILAVGMNGVPLPAEHGYPVRMVVPGLYGFVSATKWVTHLEVTRFDAFEAYWTKRGWAARAPIKTEARLELPVPYTEIRPGPTTIAGVAWAQHRGISKVEVQVDSQPWRTASLAPWNNPDTWRQWRLDWDAPQGSHALTVRATDGTGAVQTETNAAPVPDGASGYHSVISQVLR